ncbi:hypothetical protein SPRG_08350 [Saprolegnia parasitica CBS 223.65]|uniref:Aspartate racemase n=2 Tax=Saprolegnia parasitica (strain CBS 223.65) TaxID=695850 RepID=A0A067CAU2_SAPPC|nr:hypothetical protein SPRG_08350 [Saprolegnia parasitica CBS 223.65]KDO26275.1 hypothetical protein SPRG_08350 [Saprolegnia parasitica CBS 223.65]|eukprot:XP_012202981.1 hypothetical protein SPRG_08350 [Saprolegnia parasitica CBS 223.65]
MNGEVLVGILGGVGPAAGLVLHQEILRNTLNDGTDQGHLDVVHISRSADMAARPAYLAQLEAGDTEHDDAIENPAYGMARSLSMLVLAAQARSARLVVGVPCNTFHASPIWDTFAALVAAQHAADRVTLLHMLDEAVAMIGMLAPHATTIGVMSTTGSRRARIFHDRLEPAGYTVVQVPDHVQDALNDSIYNTEWGIKSTSPSIHPRAVQNFQSYAKLLAHMGAQVAILGCTEIPLALTGSEIYGMLLVDPMVALARAMLVPLDIKLPRDVHLGKPKRTLSVRSDSVDLTDACETLVDGDDDSSDEGIITAEELDSFRFCFY